MKTIEAHEYTSATLRDRLNDKFKKPSGKEFTIQDVQGYIRRGCLPDKYGGNSVMSEKSKDLGITILKLGKANRRARQHGSQDS